jgi:DNA repair protein RecO (recombination protein O)
MSVTLKSQALVLYNMRWKESSKIVHLFSEEKGYLKVIARGALRPKSPFRGTMENMNHVEVLVTIKETRGLQILSQADLINPFSHIRDDLSATAMTFSIMELLRALVHENEASHSLFRYTILCLEGLNHAPVNHPLLYLMNFILYVSENLGFGWDFQECRVCKKPAENFIPQLDPIHGALICPDCHTRITEKTYSVSNDQLKLLSGIQSCSPDLLEQWSNDVDRKNFRGLLDILISHLSYHTDQNLELKSLKMYLP